MYKSFYNVYNPYKFCLANKITYREACVGSGGGWHRDDCNKKQFKCILYLNKVNLDNGPFQYIQKSQRIGRNLIEKITNNQTVYKTRYSEVEISQYIKKFNADINTLTGNPGDLIIVDTRGLHRGKPLINGVRYALTNYVFPDTNFEKTFKKMPNYDGNLK